MSRQETIWVIDDDRSIRWVLEKAFKQAGMEVATFASAAAGPLLASYTAALVADTAVNEMPDAESLADIAAEAANVARRFGYEPRVALLAFSTFGHPPGERAATPLAKHVWVTCAAHSKRTGRPVCASRRVSSAPSWRDGGVRGCSPPRGPAHTISPSPPPAYDDFTASGTPAAPVTACRLEPFLPLPLRPLPQLVGGPPARQRHVPALGARR